MTVRVGAAAEGDLDDIKKLVVDAGLPLDGLFEHDPTEVIVAHDDGEVVGGAALELYDDAGLLRSVVVRPGYRRGGVGSALTAAAVHRARERSLQSVYLLTESAERFFAGHGFATIDRDAAPAAVAGSVEWAEVCGDSAVPMTRTVTG